jgi:hypothetical protein
LETGTVWADDRYFILQGKDKYPWPKGDSLENLTKQHWDKNLNPQYTCPRLDRMLAWANKQLMGYEDRITDVCANVQPTSKNWIRWETPSFFLFHDQVGAEEYHASGSVVTLKATGPYGFQQLPTHQHQAKEFTVMSGNMNEKVQMLQVCCPDVPVDLLICLHTHILIVPTHTYLSCRTRARGACASLRMGNARGCSAVLPTDRLRMVCPLHSP